MCKAVFETKMPLGPPLAECPSMHAFADADADADANKQMQIGSPVLAAVEQPRRELLLAVAHVVGLLFWKMYVLGM